MSRVSMLYDTLFSFESAKHEKPYPVHKKLDLGQDYPDLLDWLVDKVDFSPADRILDAGCGTGYSLLKLAQEYGVSGKGISLADNEVAFAINQTRQMDLKQQVEFEVADFKDPLEDKYDKILAIESIKHTIHIEAVLANLVEGLEEGGTLIIADDFLKEDGDKSIITHKKFWQVPGFDLITRTVNFLKEKNMKVRQFDFTSGVSKRPKFSLYILLPILGFIILLSPKRHRLKIQIYTGGLLLEQLYNLGKVGYHVLLVQKRVKQ